MRFIVSLLLIALVGCYDAPQPACGFFCGPGGACPTGYLCDVGEGRCFANGANPADIGFPCPDAGPRPVDDEPRVQFWTPGCNRTVDGHEDYSCVLVEFSEPVTGVSTDTLYVLNERRLRTQSQVERINGRAYRIVHDAPLDVDSRYTAVAEGPILDLADNRLIEDQFDFRFLPPPVALFSTSPVDQSSNISVATNIAVEFTRAVEGLSGNPFSITNPNEAFVPIEGNVTFNAFSAPSRATFDPTNQLLPFTRYDVNVSLEQGGAAPGGGFFSFFTGADDLPPSILSRDPIASAIDVSVAAEIAATFDESILVDNTTMTLRDGLGTLVPASVTFFSFSKSAALVPDLQLKSNTQYTVSFDVVDLSGNPLNTSYSFTTGPDTVVPRTITTMPLGTSINVPRSTIITITFDEVTLPPDTTKFVVNMGGIPVVGAVTTADAGRTWVFMPSAALAASTTFTVQALGATDAAGNTAPTSNWSFVTAP